MLTFAPKIPYMSFWRQKINLSIPATKMECFQILLVLRRIEDSLADLLVLTNSAAQKILTNWTNSLTLLGTTCASPIQLLFASSWKSSLSCWLLNILNIWRKPFLPKLRLHPARPWCGWLGNNDALVGCKLDGLAPVSAIDSSLRKIYQWGGAPTVGGEREREGDAANIFKIWWPAILIQFTSVHTAEQSIVKIRSRLGTQRMPFSSPHVESIFLQ